MSKRKTYSAKQGDINREWYEIDASTMPLGRIASKASTLLQGKHKPQYTPHIDVGDYVIITNVQNAPLTGKKEKEKVYYRHSWYPGAMKERTAAEQRQKDPRKLMEKAIYGMLPKNKLRKQRMRRLKIVVGSEHNHQAQSPTKVEV